MKYSWSHFLIWVSILFVFIMMFLPLVFFWCFLFTLMYFYHRCGSKAKLILYASQTPMVAQRMKNISYFLSFTYQSTFKLKPSFYNTWSVLVFCYAVCMLAWMYVLYTVCVYFLQGSAYLTGCWLHALAGWQSVKWGLSSIGCIAQSHRLPRGVLRPAGVRAHSVLSLGILTCWTLSLQRRSADMEHTEPGHCAWRAAQPCRVACP